MSNSKHCCTACMLRTSWTSERGQPDGFGRSSKRQAMVQNREIPSKRQLKWIRMANGDMGTTSKNKTCNRESLFMPPLDPLLCLWAAEPEHALVESHKVSAQHRHMKTEKHRKTINKRTWKWMKLTNRSHVHNAKKSTNDTLGFVAVWLVQLQSRPTGQSSEKEKTNYVATSLRIVFSSCLLLKIGRYWQYWIGTAGNDC